MTASIIVTSYNQLGTLRLLFESLERQTEKRFEVVIADDGSHDGTEAFCRSHHGFPVRFVTQEDMGYRKAKILNEAIRSAQGSYFIFVDGDVVLEKHFVEDHLALRKPGYFVCGRRVDLGPLLSASVSVTDASSGFFDRGLLSFPLLLSYLKGDTTELKRGWRVTHPHLRSLLGYNRPIDILGSNFSAWRTDIEAVNGFNEALEAYWGEDGDLFIRLRNTGRQAINAKALCIQYHVFHKRREADADAVRKYEERLKDTSYKWADRGLR